MLTPTRYSPGHPPKSLCILRLSALGDVVNVVPLVRTLQAHWPECQISWIIGRAGGALLDGLHGVEFIEFDKHRGLSAYRDLSRRLRGRRFDALLHMQAALRASGVSLLVKAPLRIGYDPARAKDGQRLFSNCSIAAIPKQHVLDGFFEFLRALGLPERELRWDLPIPPAAEAEMNRRWPADRKVVVVHPCSSQRWRNWRDWPEERYAAVIDHVVSRHGAQVVISGGNQPHEIDAAARIGQLAEQPTLNLSGQTNAKTLLALLNRADALIAPDTGPAHIANACHTPVIGLYASSNPMRTGPYSSQGWVVNRYPKAMRHWTGRTVEEVAWGKRVRHPEAMRLIEAQAVIDRVDHLFGVEASPRNAAASRTP